MALSPKLVWDASALIALVTIGDRFHQAAYLLWEENRDAVSIFPAIAWFELQAAQNFRAARRAEGRSIQVGSRNLYILDDKNRVLPIDTDFVQRCNSARLYERFAHLKGCDLIYACAAALEGATVVTFDRKIRQCDGLSVLPLTLDGE
jgi:predicted nucleic acid-binding protein